MNKNFSFVIGRAAALWKGGAFPKRAIWGTSITRVLLINEAWSSFLQKPRLDRRGGRK